MAYFFRKFWVFCYGARKELQGTRFNAFSTHWEALVFAHNNYDAGTFHVRDFPQQEVSVIIVTPPTVAASSLRIRLFSSLAEGLEHARNDRTGFIKEEAPLIQHTHLAYDAPSDCEYDFDPMEFM